MSENGGVLARQLHCAPAGARVPAMSRKSLLVVAAVALGLLVLAHFMPTMPAPRAAPAREELSDSQVFGTTPAQRSQIDPATVVWDQQQPTYTPIGRPPTPPDGSEAVLRELRRQQHEREFEAWRQAAQLRAVQDDVDRLQRQQR